MEPYFTEREIVILSVEPDYPSFCGSGFCNIWGFIFIIEGLFESLTFSQQLVSCDCVGVLKLGQVMTDLFIMSRV